MQLSRDDSVVGVLALPRVVIWVCFVVILDPYQEERGSCRDQGETPQGKDDVLDPASGHHHLASEGEADGQVALDAQCRDVKDRGRSAALKDVVIQAAHDFPKKPGHILPQAVQIKWQAQEDDEVRHCHAGEIEVGGSLHVLEALDDEDGHGIACHPDNENKDADDSDRDKGGGGEQGALVVVVIYVVHVLCSTSMRS